MRAWALKDSEINDGFLRNLPENENVEEEDIQKSVA